MRIRSSKNPSFSFFLSNINVLVDTGFRGGCGNLVTCGLCWDAMPTMASARLLMELFVSEF